MNRAITTGLALSVLVALGMVAALAFLTLGPAVSAGTEADRVFGQGGSFTSGDCNQGAAIPSASSLCGVAHLAVDSAGNVYVTDPTNNRVLEYDAPLTTDTVADRVFGQGGSFTTSSCNLGQSSPTASSLCFPFGVVVDGAGNLYVGDNQNGRVLQYDNPLTTDAVADRVFGPPNFTTSGFPCPATPSASSLCGPVGVAVDSTGNLYVGDNQNNRVLEYDTPLATDTVADRVFGQGGSFTTRNCNTGLFSPTASTLCGAFGVAVDGAGNLFVADIGNHRVLEYDSALGSDTVADRVFGQGGSFIYNVCNTGGFGSSPTAGTLCGPAHLAVDGAGNLYIADRDNNRVLEYDGPLDTDTVADRVFGQGASFTRSTCNATGFGSPASASSLCFPRGVAVDGAGNLYVGDSNNNRVLEYDSPLFPTPTATMTAAPTPTSSPTPTPTRTPSPTPTPCPECTSTPTPTPCPTVCPTPSPTVTRTATPTATASPTMTLTPTPTRFPPPRGERIVTFVNDTGVAASDFHFFLSQGAESLDVELVSNAPGCTAISIRVIDHGLRPPGVNIFEVTVLWPSVCVDPGESVTLRLLCFDVACFGPPPAPSCDDWTLEGAIIGPPCPNPLVTPTSTPTPTPAPTPRPGLHDGRAKKISGASSVVLSDGTPDVKSVSVQVRNEGDHTESFAVYVDIVPAGGITNPYGCTPSGRIIDTVVTLAPGEQAIVQTSPTFDCADVAGALNQTYTIMAAVDVHADDGGACGPFQIQTMTCFNALADDDNDPADNRATTNAFRVK